MVKYNCASEVWKKNFEGREHFFIKNFEVRLLFHALFGQNRKKILFNKMKKKYENYYS